MSWFVLGSETSSELDHVVPSWIMAVGSAPGPAAVCDHGWGCLPEPFCSRKKLIRMKTTTLAPPLAPGSGPSLAVIEEANSTSPQYQSVPDFQRVQISGDYASGVGTSMAAPFPYWPPLWSLPVPQQCRDTRVCTNGESVSQLSLCLTRAEFLSWSCGVLHIPMGFSRQGLAGRAVLTLSHPLCLHTALSV